MDDFAKEVITKMETYEKKEKRQFNKYDMAIGLFYGVGIFLGIGIFFVGGFMTMSGAGWGASLFGGGCFSLVFGLICPASPFPPLSISNLWIEDNRNGIVCSIFDGFSEELPR